MMFTKRFLNLLHGRLALVNFEVCALELVSFFEKRERRLDFVTGAPTTHNPVPRWDNTAASKLKVIQIKFGEMQCMLQWRTHDPLFSNLKS